MPTPRKGHENHLLAALPRETLARLRPYLKRVSLRLEEVLYESGAMMRWVYFPID